MNGTANGLYGGDLPNQINTPWIDFSEQSTIVGWSSFTAKVIRYKVIGNIVYVYFNIIGTSNSSSTTFTLPISTKFFQGAVACYGVDNGAPQIGLISQPIAPSNSFTANRYTAISNGISSSWTGSGTKQIQGQFFYEI
jgi:hypothetical protein